ncbi:low molecular weight phosphatase family protein [Mycolicibacterium aichiense]|uniref:arsenate reductase/protein-tyrosine-phosphatase family protein n=1 Tax=Mycolicibacterium aichiense TaxID=1799 RepID=UPI003AF92D20
MFVCTGNICRSPIAERLAVAYADQARIPDLSASSAGIRAVIAHPIHRDAATVLESLGGDAADFAARQFKPKTVSGVDLIITMTTAHRDAALEIVPQKLHRTFTLSEAAQLASVHGAKSVVDLPALRPKLTPQELFDIPDPIGQDPEVFAAVGTQIAALLPPILELCRAS